MTTITKYQNRYRTMNTHFVSFPCAVDNLEIESYTKDNGMSRMKGLSVFTFDTISYLRTSEKGYMHCVGLAGSEVFQIVLKENKYGK